MDRPLVVVKGDKNYHLIGKDYTDFVESLGKDVSGNFTTVALEEGEELSPLISKIAQDRILNNGIITIIGWPSRSILVHELTHFIRVKKGKRMHREETNIISLLWEEYVAIKVTNKKCRYISEITVWDYVKRFWHKKYGNQGGISKCQEKMEPAPKAKAHAPDVERAIAHLNPLEGVNL